MRQGEILGLTWDRVDLTRGVLVLTATKSGRTREVLMDKTVYATISKLRQQKGSPTAGLLFAKPDGRPWGRLTTGFKVALRKAGISDFKFHDLRDTSASWLVMSGVSLHETAEILGHSTLAMTRRYSHLARRTSERRSSGSTTCSGRAPSSRRRPPKPRSRSSPRRT